MARQSAENSDDVVLAQQAADLIEQRVTDLERPRQLSLKVLAADLGATPTQLQKAFSRVVGISPWDYGAEKRAQAFRANLKDAASVTDAIYAAGYGSPSRVYEQSGFLLGMSPASYAKHGQGACISFDIVDSPLGRLLVATTEVGLCFLAFGEDDEDLRSELAMEFKNADRLSRDEVGLRDVLDDVVAHLETGKMPSRALALDVQGTAFQRRVWQALLAIPTGGVVSYADLGLEMGMEAGQRAVAKGCATNKVSLLIPCHRIVRSDGTPGGYRWGVKRKQRLLAMETQRIGAKEGQNSRDPS